MDHVIIHFVHAHTHTHTHTYTHTYVHTHTHRVRQTDIQTDLTSSHCKCRTNVVETDQSNAACAWDDFPNTGV